MRIRDVDKAIGIALMAVFLAIRTALSYADLAARLQQRESQASAELYDRYGRTAFALILRVVRDAAIAEDLVQETFFRVWNRIHGFDAERGALGPWILAVARNRAIDYVRSVAGRQSSSIDLEQT